MIKCPDCQSEQIKKNGHTHYGKQNYCCKDCGRQFVENGSDWFVNDQEKALINKLLLERISLSGICRACNVSPSWLLHHIKELYANLPEDLNADLTLPELDDYLAARMDEEITRLVELKKIQKYLKSIQQQPCLKQTAKNFWNLQ